MKKILLLSIVVLLAVFNLYIVNTAKSNSHIFSLVNMEALGLDETESADKPYTLCKVGNRTVNNTGEYYIWCGDC